MEWLSQCINQIVQSQIWRFIVSHFYWVDWGTVAFVFIGLIYGIQRGFLRTGVKTLELLGIAFVTLTWQEMLASKLHIYLPFIVPAMLPVTGFAVIALPLTLLVELIDSRLGKLFHTTLSAPVRAAGGVVTGIFFGLFLWSFISQALLLTPYRPLRKSYEKGISISGPFLKTFAPQILRKVKP